MDCNRRRNKTFFEHNNKVIYCTYYMQGDRGAYLTKRLKECFNILSRTILLSERSNMSCLLPLETPQFEQHHELVKGNWLEKLESIKKQSGRGEIVRMLVLSSHLLLDNFPLSSLCNCSAANPCLHTHTSHFHHAPFKDYKNLVWKQYQSAILAMSSF